MLKRSAFVNLFFCFSVGILFLIGCKKSKKEESPQTTPVTPPAGAFDNLSAADLALLDQLKTDTTTRLSDLKYSDGTSIKDFLLEHDPAFLSQHPGGRLTKMQDFNPAFQKKFLIGRMFAMGFYLTYRPSHTYPSEGANKPAQYGLAYLSGSKQYSKRQKATKGACTTEELYGLDCSGMLYQMTSESSLVLTTDLVEKCNVASLSELDRWNTAFKKSADYKNLHAEKMGSIDKSEFKMGDVLFWSGHVGVILASGGDLAFFQSAGNTEQADCEPNKGPKRGPSIKTPITKEFLDYFQKIYGSYNVLRIFTDTLIKEIEIPKHHLGDDAGNEGILFEKFFTIVEDLPETKECFLTLSIQGPHYEKPPVVMVNSQSIGSIQSFFPNPGDQINPDGSHDYNGTFVIKVNVKSLLTTGVNLFTIKNGRPDDDYTFSNVHIGLTYE